MIFITIKMTTCCHIIPLILMKLSKFYTEKVKCVLIGFAFTAYWLIQTCLRPLVYEKEQMQDPELSNLDQSKLHAMKKLKY